MPFIHGAQSSLAPLWYAIKSIAVPPNAHLPRPHFISRRIGHLISPFVSDLPGKMKAEVDDKVDDKPGAASYRELPNPRATLDTHPALFDHRPRPAVNVSTPSLACSVCLLEAPLNYAHD